MIYKNILWKSIRKKVLQKTLIVPLNEFAKNLYFKTTW